MEELFGFKYTSDVWNKIRKDYPKTYKKIDDYFKISQSSGPYGNEYPYYRKLYSFFDEVLPNWRAEYGRMFIKNKEFEMIELLFEAIEKVL